MLLTIYKVNYLNYISDELKDAIYAKLCAILIFYGIVGCTEVKKNTELSLTKAFIELKRESCF